MAAKRQNTSSAAPTRAESVLPPATEQDVRVRVFEGHMNTVWRVAMPEDGRFALTISEDGTVRRWALAEDVAKGEVVCKGRSCARGRLRSMASQ